VAQWCQQHRHDPVREPGARSMSNFGGHYQYYGRPTNYAVCAVLSLVRRLWHQVAVPAARGKRLDWGHVPTAARASSVALAAYCSCVAQDGESCVRNECVNCARSGL